MRWEGFGELPLPLWEALGVSLLLAEMLIVVPGQLALELVAMDDVLAYQLLFAVLLLPLLCALR